jgi:hypothetical protein
VDDIRTITLPLGAANRGLIAPILALSEESVSSIPHAQ